jgi:hypothetical protein
MRPVRADHDRTRVNKISSKSTRQTILKDITMNTRTQNTAIKLENLNLSREKNLCITKGKIINFNGRIISSGKWRGLVTSEYDLFSSFNNHLESSKFGSAFCPVDLAGIAKTKNAVKSINSLVYDVDNGTPIEELTRILHKAGHQACIYTTHSHGKTETGRSQE